jgi:hypothetical protein
MGRFKFLSRNYKELYQLCSDAERNVDNADNEIDFCLLKERKALERLLS